MRYPLKSINQYLTDACKLLDVGSLNFSQYKRVKEINPNVRHYGIDYCDPEESTPHDYVFKKADLNKEPIPFEDDLFDVVIASHIIEHLNDPINFFKECIRVLKPGGILYVEAPSEKALKFSGMPFEYEKFYSLSLYDDPTHTMRPWTPQSFYRLTKYFACNPLHVGYIRSWKVRLLSPLLLTYAYLTKNGFILERTIWLTHGWASYLIAEKDKSLKGTPPFNYYIPINSRK